MINKKFKLQIKAEIRSFYIQSLQVIYKHCRERK